MAEDAEKRDLAELMVEVDAHRAEETCSRCTGSGKIAGFGEDPMTCPRCRGTGVVRPQWPRVITGIEMPNMATMLNTPSFGGAAPGTFVAVRLASGDKTHLGLYLGAFASSLLGGVKPDGTLSLTFGMGNPAIWVPDLGRIVRGYESWWGEIESPEDLREITDADIDNIWYVQALRQIEARATRKAEAGSPDEPAST